MNRLSFRTMLLLALAACTPLSAVMGQPYFVGTGDLPGGLSQSIVHSLSSDGNVVVGDSFDTSARRGYRWEISQGMTVFDAPGSPNAESYCYDVSEDGDSISGTFYIPGLVEAVAFRWNIDGSVDYVVCEHCFSGMYTAEFISDAGVCVAGNAQSRNAYYWRHGLGSIEVVTPLSGTITHATDISGDGNYVVGYATNLVDIERAYRFRTSTGSVLLGDLPGGTDSSRARAASYDGNIIVGRSNSGNNQSPTQFEAFRWTPESGMVGLGDLPGGVFSSNAAAVSADGGVIAGTGTTERGTETFYWTQATGMRRLIEVLREYGLDPEADGWQLTSVAALSGDGLVIAGNGINPDGNPEGWVANLRGFCPADFNADGVRNSQDFFDFLTALFTTPACPEPCMPGGGGGGGGGGCPADFNRDCAINSADFFDFLAAFLAGCE